MHRLGPGYKNQFRFETEAGQSLRQEEPLSSIFCCKQSRVGNRKNLPKKNLKTNLKKNISKGFFLGGFFKNMKIFTRKHSTFFGKCM
jgi:hypothetical protein